MPGPQSYSKKMIEYFRHPRNVGTLENADGVGKATNEKTVFIELTIRVEDETIVEAKFKTLGCGAAIAASSMVTELITGKTLTEALDITNTDIVDALDGLPDEKLHCSLLAEEAIKAAVEDFRNKKKAG